VVKTTPYDVVTIKNFVFPPLLLMLPLLLLHRNRNEKIGLPLWCSALHGVCSLRSTQSVPA
jgi:hypothetical protein